MASLTRQSSDRGRALTVSERIDAFFSQNDEFDTDISSFDDKQYALIINEENKEPVPSSPAIQLNRTTSSQFEYQWQFRHTISYWISMNFICGSLLFTTGSFFWLIEDSLTSTDFYVLVTVAFFAGGTCFGIGAYLGYYEVINEQSTYNPKHRKYRRRSFCCYLGRKNLSYWTALTYFIGTLLYQINVTLGVLRIEYEFKSLAWYIFIQLPIFLGGICFLIGGLCEMYLNKAYKWRPTKLGWIVSWLNGFGGFTFFLAGIGLFYEDKQIVLWMTIIPYLIGSVAFLIGAILSLLMWKLQQFGLVYLPHLNVEGETLKTRKKKGANIVLYRDIFFLCLYVITWSAAITAITYASLCHQYADWIKNFALALIGSIVILAIGSFMHREPEKPPFSYILWFLRFFMFWYTINLIIDAYHVSGAKCQSYGGKGRGP